MELSALGLTDRQIADRLGVAKHAVSAHAGRAQAKLGVRLRAHAVALLMAAKVIEGPESVEVIVVAPGQSLTDFAEDYRIYRQRRLTHREITAVMGYRSNKTVGRLVSRARAAGLLPKPDGRVKP